MPKRKPAAKNTGTAKVNLGAKGARARSAHRRPAGASAKKRAAVGPNVLVVNMIPMSLSGETNQDSEPTLAVNPTNPSQIAASAFTPDPGGGDFAPIYVSTDGGNTWILNSIVPSDSASGSMTADITVAFGGSSNLVYPGIFPPPNVKNSTRIKLPNTSDFFTLNQNSLSVDPIC